MAEVIKEGKKMKVMAGTFPAAASDQAKRMVASMADEGIKGFSVKPAENLPGYIQVVIECDTKEAADKVIQEAKAKKITVCICE